MAGDKASKTVEICNALGLHARAATKFVQLASSFASEVGLEKDGQRVNGKSIMGLMMLAAGRGETISITTEGEDEEQAMAELEALVTSGFGDSE